MTRDFVVATLLALALLIVTLALLPDPFRH